MDYLEIIDDCSDWCVIPPVSSFNFKNDNDAEKVEEIDVKQDDEKNSDSSSSKSGSSIAVIDEEEAENTFLCPPHLPQNDATSITSQLPNLGTSTLTQRSESQLICSPKTYEFFKKFREVILQQIETVSEIQNVLNQAVDLSTITETQDRKKGTNSQFPSRKKIIEEQKKNTSLFLFLLSVFLLLVVITADLRNETLNHKVSALQRENFLLKKQMLHNQRKENRKLMSLTSRISTTLEEKNYVTRHYLEQLKVGQKEIALLTEEVSSLETNYKALRNLCMEDSSKFHDLPSDNETKSNHQMMNLSLEKYSELIMLLNQNLNLTKTEANTPEECFVNFKKNTIGSITLFPGEYSFSAIVSYYSEALKLVENYIYEKDIASRFAEYIDTLKSVGSKSYESAKELFLCLERCNGYKGKVEQIKNSMDTLIKELNELKTYV